MLCRNAAVFDVPLPLPPFSQTTTLSNLMFEIAWADASASLSMCSSISSWNACLAPPHASMICLQALALLGQDLVLPAGLGFELGEDRRGLGLGLDAWRFSASASASTMIFAFSALAGASSAARCLGLDLLGLGQRRLGHRPVLRLQHRGLGLALLRLARAGTPRPS